MAGNELVTKLASTAGVTEKQYYETIMKTVMPAANVSPEHVLAFLQVAAAYDLNPLTREIYAFPGKGGGIQSVVGIDGWMKLANRNPQFDGLETQDVINEQGELVAITCLVYRKDRQHPVTATEYMVECKRQTDPWKQWPRRMLRHKATIQGLRYAFGFAGIVDPDEAERWHEADSTVENVAQATQSKADNIRARLSAAHPAGVPVESSEIPPGASQDIGTPLPSDYFTNPTVTGEALS